MDDNLKIKALMIYCHHWGLPQARIRAATSGIQQTHDALSKSYQDFNTKKSLHNILQDIPKDNKTFWYSITRSLLGPTMEHFFPYEDEGDDWKYLYKILKLSQTTELTFLKLYTNHLSPQEIQSLDSIIALPVEKHL